MPTSHENLESDRRSSVRAVLSFVLALAILGVAVGVAALLFATAPKASKKQDARATPSVEVLEVNPTSHVVRILTQGVVESRRETQIAPEVRGKVVEISPNLKQGGNVTEGETLIRIEDADFRSALASASSALAEAELALVQEEARSAQALIDWQRLGRGGAGPPLVLREPQLKAAKAMIESAREEVSRTTRDLERTRVTAPFDAAVRQASAEVGSIAVPGQMIAELYADRDLQIRLPLPLEDYGFVQRGPAGEPLGEIELSGKIGVSDFKWSATSIKLDPEIDRRTLSGHWIVRVNAKPDSPFPLPPVGIFLQAAITGNTLENVFEIPRRAIREGDEVLVVNPQNRIEFRKLEIIRRTPDSAIVRSGLSAGERICLTRLNAPIAGMEVRLGELD